MNLSLSRNTKNRILIGADLVMVLLTAAKLHFEPVSVSGQMQLWLVVSPPILVLATVARGAAFARVVHAGLFLVTGAAIGLTLGAVLSDAATVWLLERAWLALALIAAVLHYSPSGEDEYLPAARNAHFREK